MGLYNGEEGAKLSSLLSSSILADARTRPQSGGLTVCGYVNQSVSLASRELCV